MSMFPARSARPSRVRPRLPRLAGTVLSVAVLASLVTVTAAPTGQASTAQPVPSRAFESPFAAKSDADLGAEIAKAGDTAVIGLKAPGQARGVWKATVLVDDAQWRAARRAVLSQNGVTLVSADPVLPTLVVKLADQAALAAVRRLPVIDYVEPPMTTPRPMSSLGCGLEAYDPATQPVPPLERIDDGGDVIPWNFNHSKIREGWARGGTGAGANVVVLDTGVYEEQRQLWNAPWGTFSGGLSGPRSVSYRTEMNSRPTYDECSHGTKMAGTIAAPRDRRNMVGVAWQANLRMVKVIDDVVVGTDDEDDPIIWGIRSALSDRPPRAVVAMAFGDHRVHSRIADEIRRWHYDPHYPGGVLFVGAAGTNMCPIWAPVAFPARMDEVVAVTGRAPGGGLHPSACTGPEVDLAAVIDEAPTTGRNPDDLVRFGGSSNATAIVAGLAAMVWSKYPTWTRDQVRDRMYHTTWGSEDPQLGRGVVDAYGATGGFLRVWIDGPDTVEPRETYTLTAAPVGDGPFAYRWSNGATTPEVTVTAGAHNTYQRMSVTVTDLGENKSLTRTKTVKAQSEL
jgi:serine protease